MKLAPRMARRLVVVPLLAGAVATSVAAISTPSAEKRQSLLARSMKSTSGAQRRATATTAAAAASAAQATTSQNATTIYGLIREALKNNGETTSINTDTLVNALEWSTAEAAEIMGKTITDAQQSAYIRCLFVTYVAPKTADNLGVDDVEGGCMGLLARSARPSKFLSSISITVLSLARAGAEARDH